MVDQNLEVVPWFIAHVEAVIERIEVHFALLSTAEIMFGSQVGICLQAFNSRLLADVKDRWNRSSLCGPPKFAALYPAGTRQAINS
jgi:hypothetical protein